MPIAEFATADPPTPTEAREQQKPEPEQQRPEPESAKAGPEELEQAPMEAGPPAEVPEPVAAEPAEEAEQPTVTAKPKRRRRRRGGRYRAPIATAQTKAERHETQPEQESPGPEVAESPAAEFEQALRPKVEQRPEAEAEREVAPRDTDLLASLLEPASVGIAAKVRLENAHTSVAEPARAEPEQPLQVEAEPEPEQEQRAAASVAGPPEASADQEAAPSAPVARDQAPVQDDDLHDEPAPLAEPDACEIAVWKGYRKARFYARVLATDGTEFALAESDSFRWRGNGSVDQTEDAAAAHQQLLDHLASHGWSVDREAPTWYVKTLKRS